MACPKSGLESNRTFVGNIGLKADSGTSCKQNFVIFGIAKSMGGYRHIFAQEFSGKYPKTIASGNRGEGFKYKVLSTKLGTCTHIFA